MAPLSWRHHTLLQALLTRGPLPERDFHAVFAAVSGKDPGTYAIFFCSLSSLYASLPNKCSTKRSCAMPAIFQARGSSQSMAPLSWRQRHHTLLQALLSRGPLAEPDFYAIFAAVSDRDPATHQQLFNDTLLKINKDLAYLQFELRACINQYDGLVYYGVVNNIADEESKLGTKYSVPQIAFYKGLLEAVVQEAGNDGSITSIDALNVRLDNQVIIVDGSQDSQPRLPTSIKNFTMSQKEKTLDELIRDRWLSYTSTGKIGLGIRSFLDLRSWFRGNDIPSCVVCNEACIKASSCPNEGCNVRIHEYCLKKKFSQRKASRACPSCGTEWPRQDGEAHGDDDVNEPVEDQAPSATHSSRKRRKRVKAELLEENDNAGPSTAVPRRRRTARNAKAEAVEAAQEASTAEAPQATRPSKRRK
ncbi:hypothetical protein BAE44_0020748 [Dichanthelium oligosanthes]|uniref:Non-structural maintenance of chromosomes element 1 homolog n=1 Tax=Dichanthelium oligosanthes TaxID=888268 RepID=A0A1E5UZ88_9POAL|nr:hypothetical protein BAE44_0020748 [Dichanthelium oligosanthes]